MSWNPFTWIRAASRNAFLGGIEDGIEMLSDDGAIIIEIRRRELPAMPQLAALADGPEAEPTKTRKK